MADPAHGNETRANAFQAYDEVLNNALNLTVDANAKRDYLQDIHKAIAKKRIERYLADHGGRGVVAANALPDRPAPGMGVATIAQTDNRDYENYAAIIDATVYNADNLNGFVVEVCTAINTQRTGITQVEA